MTLSQVFFLKIIITNSRLILLLLFLNMFTRTIQGKISNSFRQISLFHPENPIFLRILIQEFKGKNHRQVLSFNNNNHPEIKRLLTSWKVFQEKVIFQVNKFLVYFKPNQNISKVNSHPKASLCSAVPKLRRWAIDLNSNLKGIKEGRKAVQKEYLD